MSKWFSGFGSALMAIVTVASGVITIVGWAVPSLRDWLGAHPALAWGLCSIITVLGGAWLVVLLARLKERTNDLTKREETVASLSAQCAAESDRSSDLKSRLDAMHAERIRAEGQVAGLQASVAELEARLHPTEHDLAYFAELMDYFAWNRGVMDWLAEAFVPKRWTQDQVRPLYVFNDTWGHRYFDDQVVQAVYGDFRRATKALGNWLAGEGAYEDADNTTVARILDGNRRRGGWREYDAAIREALSLRNEVIRARQELERVGRQRGLKLPTAP